eukprot:7426202-Pyramimonas_sp.AAC.1
MGHRVCVQVDSPCASSFALTPVICRHPKDARWPDKTGIRLDWLQKTMANMDARIILVSG